MAAKLKKKKSQVALSPREIKVITLVCKEKTKEQIAKVMKMSPSWVDYCKAGIYKKINAHSPIGMAMYAVKHGIYKL